MPQTSQDRDRLNSWKEIAAYLNRSVRTVIRWEAEQGLPVHRQIHDKRGAVHAYMTELDAWVQQRTLGPEPAEPVPAADARPKRRRAFWTGTGAVLVAVAVWLVLPGPRLSPPPLTRPLTTYPGSEVYPALSPDGDRVVFAWDHENPDSFDLYVKQIGSDAAPVRLTAKPARRIYPAWSPDGKRIAFARALGQGKHELAWVPAGGGPERHIAETFVSLFATPPFITWTPDGKWIVTPHQPVRQDPAEIYLAAVEGGEMRRVRTGLPQEVGDLMASFSPDGRWLAVAHRPSFTSQSIQLIPMSPGWQPAAPAETVDAALWCCWTQLAWTPDSRQMLYAKMWENAVSVWRRGVAGGTSQPLIAAGQLGSGGVAFSARRNRLAYSDYRAGSRIWRLNLGASGTSPEPYLSSAGYERSPAISLDGTQVAFTSSRMEGGTIWICDAAGTNERRLTHIGGGAPRWSPDGRQVAFDAVVDGNEDIYVVAVPEGRTRRVTTNVGQAVLPTWSADGNWIYFCSKVTGHGAVIWKTRANGQGEPVKITGGWVAQEALDGSALYVAKFDSPPAPTLWKKLLPDGPETLLIPSIANIRNFAVARDGIYYEASRDEHSFAILFYRFSNGRSEVIAEIRKTPFEGMALAPAGNWLLFSTVEEHPGDLWLVDNFQ